MLDPTIDNEGYLRYGEPSPFRRSREPGSGPTMMMFRKPSSSWFELTPEFGCGNGLRLDSGQFRARYYNIETHTLNSYAFESSQKNCQGGRKASRDRRIVGRPTAR